MTPVLPNSGEAAEISVGHIQREARAEAACDGHEYDYNDLRRSERLRYEESAAEVAAHLYGRAALPAHYRRMLPLAPRPTTRGGA